MVYEQPAWNDACTQTETRMKKSCKVMWSEQNLPKGFKKTHKMTHEPACNDACTQTDTKMRKSCEVTWSDSEFLKSHKISKAAHQICFGHTRLQKEHWIQYTQTIKHGTNCQFSQIFWGSDEEKL